MEPLITLVVVVTLALLAAGALGVRRFFPWPVALRGGLAARTSSACGMSWSLCAVSTGIRLRYGSWSRRRVR